MSLDIKISRLQLRDLIQSKARKAIKGEKFDKLETAIGGFQQLVGWLNDGAPKINRRDLLILSPVLLSACAGFQPVPIKNYPKLQGKKIQVPEFYNGKGGCYVGYFGGTPGFFGSLTGKKPSASHLPLYTATVTGGISERCIEQMVYSAKAGAIPFISYDVDSIHRGALDFILSGKSDKRAQRSARRVVAYGKKYGGFFIRTCREFNLDVRSYGPPEKVKEHFKKQWEIFEEEGANEYATWVWNPFVTTGCGPWENYYPGDKYVDWIGMNGYNWANTYPNTRQRSVKSLFSHAYRAISQKHPDKPIMIAETGSVNNKAKPKWFESIDWLKETNIKCIMFWHDYYKSRGGAVMDCRIDSSKAALASFKKAISDPHFLTPVLYNR